MVPAGNHRKIFAPRMVARMNDRAILRSPAVVMDVSDLVRAAAFWGRLLGVEPGQPRSNGDYLTVGQFGSGATLVLQRVIEAHQVKNRVHLDFTVDDVDGVVDLILGLGGTCLAKRFTGDGATMADPDGNEFCIAPATVEATEERIRDT